MFENLINSFVNFILLRGVEGQIAIIVFNLLLFGYLLKVHADRFENIFLLFMYFSIILFFESIVLLYLVSNGWLEIDMKFVLGMLSFSVISLFVTYLFNRTSV